MSWKETPLPSIGSDSVDSGGAGTLRSERVRIIQRRVLRWYEEHGRPLPWRRTRNPYRILLSEVMLQQTQVSRILLAYPAFLKRFPTLASLARAKQREVVVAWRGLGYNSRAVRLYRLAHTVLAKYRGNLPRSYDELIRLPGVGPNTARALLCFAFGVSTHIMEVNVRRVLTRMAWSVRHIDAVRPPRDVEKVAASMLPRHLAFDWNQGLMDLGATVCTLRSPRCGICPIGPLCASYRQIGTRRIRAPQKGPTIAGMPVRLCRGRVLERLRDIPRGRWCPVKRLEGACHPGRRNADSPLMERVLTGLERDGLIMLRRGEDHRNRFARLA